MLLSDSIFENCRFSSDFLFIYLKNFFHMEKILQFPFYRVQKLEYPIVFNRSLAIFGKHNPDELFLSEIVNAVKAKQPLADSLKVQKMDHPLTGSLLIQAKMRKYYTNALWNQIKMLNKANDNAAVKDEKVAAVFEFSKTYFESFFAKRASIRGQITTQFLSDLEENAGMKQYFTDLGLTILTGKIKEMHQGMQVTNSQRTAELSNRYKSETNKITKELEESLRILFSAVNVAMVAHPEVDYQPLVNELNTDLKVMKASLKQTGKAQEEDPAENGETTTEEAV